MTSTSSSESDCTTPFSSDNIVSHILRNPFCPSTLRPLIYYANIDEPFHPQRNTRDVKDNSKYFRKAFQWYTQELRSEHKNEIVGSKADHSDFAAWLDKKYSEYLHRSQQDGSQLILKQSTTPKGDKGSKKQKSTRKFGRMRSPWKRRRHANNKEKGDIPPINQSIEYILQPHDLRKPTSEYCQRTTRIQSSTTIMTKESSKHIKVQKSKSLLSIYRAPGTCENKEVKTKSHNRRICECLNSNKGTQYDDTVSNECLTTSRFEGKKVISKKNTPKKDSHSKVLCECPSQCSLNAMDGAILLNTHTTRQHSQSNEDYRTLKEKNVITKKYYTQRLSRSNVLCECPHVSLNEMDGVIPLNTHTTLQDGQSNEDYKSDIKKQTYSSKMLPTGIMFVENLDMKARKLQHDSAQTSDHSIDLENVMNEQPILLNIVRVDGQITRESKKRNCPVA